MTPTFVQSMPINFRNALHGLEQPVLNLLRFLKTIPYKSVRFRKQPTPVPSEATQLKTVLVVLAKVITQVCGNAVELVAEEVKPQPQFVIRQGCGIAVLDYLAQPARF